MECSLFVLNCQGETAGETGQFWAECFLFGFPRDLFATEPPADGWTTDLCTKGKHVIDGHRPNLADGPVMPAFLYRCPNTDKTVQGFVAEELNPESAAYEAVQCVACARLHLVNAKSGRVLGGDDEE